MESHCILHSELPGAGLLFTDFLYRFERVARFYPYDPADPQAIRRAAQRLDYPAERRARLVAALRAQNGDGEAVERLARPGTVAVVTGQQVGLLGGPAYSVYKALTALRLARRLSEEGLPAVAVFWLATEDHDIAEVNHCWVFNAEGEPVRIEASGLAADGRAAGALRVPEGVLDSLREALGGLPFAQEALRAAGESYAPGASLGGAFAALLRGLLGRWGLLCLDPLEPGVRELLAPLLARAAEAGAELARLVLERNAQLQAAGYSAQVRFQPDSSLLFLLESGRRLSLKREGEDYVCGGRRWSASELAGRAAELSAAALLRPVVQDWALPAAAVVMGPAEIAYWAQSQPLYEALGVKAPACVPRASWTLLDGRAARLMNRYGLQLADFFAGREALRERIARRLIPAELEELLRGAGAEIAGALEKLGAGLSGFDPSLARAFEQSRRKMLYQLSKIERKTGREALRRQERVAREAARLFNLVYPRRRLQERFYSILPFVARHGPALLERLYEAVMPECRDHRVLVL